MLPSTLWRLVRDKKALLNRPGHGNRRYVIHVLGVFLLLSLTCIELVTLSPYADAHSHTSPTVDENCQRVGYSPDGNPFPLCPGPYPTGGNCVWWAWEQWHLLGYDLPLNWGNAADWIVDAERTGLPMGTTPRVGSIAVFPRADGVWAYGPPGHVAFVTSVSNDGSTFNVTYQNYGDSTPMYIGNGYNVSVINQERFQNGQMRFIYFPQQIDQQRFLRLPGIGSTDPTAIVRANQLFNKSASTFTGSHVILGIQPLSSDQEFNADFTGTGFSDLLLYNRQQGRLEVLKLRPVQPQGTQASHLQGNHPSSGIASTSNPDLEATSRAVSLGDATTPTGKWGSSLDVHIGDFDGTGHSEILLYDRVTGTIQIISLTPQLTIKKHTVLTGWGPDWEVYVGRFDGQRSGLFMYKRYAQSIANVNPSSPTVVPTSGPTKKSTVTPSSPSPTPTHKPSPTPKASPTPAPSPTATPKASPTPKPSPTATPKASPTPSPTATATPKSNATASPSPTVTPKPSPTVSPSPTATGTPSPTPSATPKSNQKNNGTNSPDGKADFVAPLPTSSPTPGKGDLSGNALEDWEKQGRTANVVVLDFNKDLSIHSQQKYTLWHANWEVYVGRFASSNQDGIFLYDRLVGEGRIMDFDKKLVLADYQEMHNLDGNWIVSSGDFTNSGRAQLFLYDPGSGDGQTLAFDRTLRLSNQRTYAKMGANLVPYVGHFGMQTLSVMLYNAQASQSTFIAFDKSLAVTQKVTVKSWGQRWQMLVGSFLDRSRCPKGSNCSTSDDILLLDRQTGQMGQYVFSFGRKFRVFDNRSQAFSRQGVTYDSRLSPVDTTKFSLLATLSTSIRNEELY